MNTFIDISPPGVQPADGLAAIVAAQAPRLRAFVRRQVADLGEVEDILQDAFLELVSAERLAAPVLHVAAWLRRVARNRIIDTFRRRVRSERLFVTVAAAGLEPGGDALSAPAPDSACPDVSYERESFARRLSDALDELSPGQREVFVAHELEGRSFKEIAAATGVPLNTLLSRKHAAVLHLRGRLRDFDSQPIA